MSSKNEFKYSTPRKYEVTFSSGATIEVMAVSSYDAKRKTSDEQMIYGSFISAREIG